MSQAGTVATPSSILRGTIRPAPMVTQAVRGDATVLADFRHARYYTLNPVSGRIWALVREGITVPALLTRLHDEYDAPPEQIDADALAFLKTLRASHLITCQPVAALPASRSADTSNLDSIERHGAALGTEAESALQRIESDTASGAVRVPSMLRCGLLILTVKLSLRVLGFARTWWWIQHRTKRMAIRDDTPTADIAATEYRIALVAALWPGRALCLEQSLVLYYVLRCGGVLAEFRMGVQPHPFLAHAWVEYHGAPVNDFPEHVAQMEPMERLPL